MIVDFRDSASIRAWLAIRPEHLDTMRVLWRLMPQCREAMEAATKPPS